MGFTRPKRKKTTAPAAVIRVEIEHSDGTITRLSGDKAQEWAEGCNNVIAAAYVHGVLFPTINWETFKKE